MDQRKKKEIEYYDKKAEKQLNFDKVYGDFEGFDPFVLESYKFLKKITKRKIRNKKVLDYGCGNGIHSGWLAAMANKVVAIDLSPNSLDVAKQRNKKENLEFLLMDCERLNFADNSFDVIFDGGTFSSLDLNKSFPELARVLRPDGCLVGIETFGHNPLTNLKRKLNEKTGKRTEWAASHIFKIKDLKLAGQHFDQIQVYYFHIISWLAIPFLKLPGGKILLKILELMDHLLRPILKRYSFKVVFIFSQPKKYVQKII